MDGRNFLAPPFYYSQRAVFASLRALFSYEFDMDFGMSYGTIYEKTHIQFSETYTDVTAVG